MDENNNENVQNTENQDTISNEEVKSGEVSGAGTFDSKDVEDNKLMAILSYVGVLSLIPYLVDKDSKWVRFHAIQGVNLLILEAIIMVIGVIPLLGWFVSWLGGIVMSIISIMGIINVCNGEAKELPLVKNFHFIKK